MTGGGEGDPEERRDPSLGFAYARCTMAPDGAVAVDHSGDQMPRLLGVTLTGYLASPHGAELGAAIRVVLDLLRADAAEIQVSLSLVDPSGRSRSLLANVHGLRVVDQPNATVGLREVAAAQEPPFAELARAGALRPALMILAPRPGGGLEIAFIEDDVGRLVGVMPDKLARMPAMAVIRARAAAILAAPDFSAQSPLATLTIADSSWGGRAFQARFFRGVSGDGAPSIGLRIGEATPPDGLPRADDRHVDGLLRLLRISGILLDHPSLARGLVLLADEIATTPGLRHALIARLSGKRLLVAARSRARHHIPLADTALSLVEGPCAEAIRGQHLVVDGSAPESGLRLYAPIEAGGEVLGVLALWADADFAVDGWQEEILCSCADYVAALLANRPARPRALREGANEGRRDEIDVAALLTPRQQEVLFSLVEAGGRNRDIAHSLATTEATVKVHMRAILGALRVESRAEALQLVYRRGAGWLARMHRRQRDLGP